MSLSDFQQIVNRDAIIDRMLIEHGKSEATVTKIVQFLNTLFAYRTSPEVVRQRFEQLQGYQEQLSHLLTLPVVKQRSEEWHAMRKNLITASDMAQALGKGKFGTQKQLIAKKCPYEPEVPFDGSHPAMQWGVLFEPVALEIYRRRNAGILVHEFGLLPHPTRDYVGASPDGITELGIMVEIKCPYQRAITGAIPEQYAYQIQGQLDVCGLQECDYVECAFDMYDNAEHFWEEYHQTPAWKGIVFQVLGSSETLYSPLDADAGALRAWVQDTQDMLRRKQATFKISYWNLVLCNVVRVYRDQAFIDQKMAMLRDVWDRILKYRGDAVLYHAEMGSKSSKSRSSQSLSQKRSLSLTAPTLSISVDLAERSSDLQTEEVDSLSIPKSMGYSFID